MNGRNGRILHSYGSILPDRLSIRIFSLIVISKCDRCSRIITINCILSSSPIRRGILDGSYLMIFCFFHHCFTFFSFPIVKKRSDHVHVVNDYADKPWTRGQVMITQTPSPQANDSADIVSVINDYADIVSA